MGTACGECRYDVLGPHHLDVKRYKVSRQMALCQHISSVKVIRLFLDHLDYDHENKLTFFLSENYYHLV